MTEELFCYRDCRECDRPARPVMYEVMEPYCCRLMLLLSKFLLYDALFFLEFSFMNNVPRNFLCLCKNGNVNRSGEISSLHKSNFALLFFLFLFCARY
jgi:hypothetical protein